MPPIATRLFADADFGSNCLSVASAPSTQVGFFDQPPGLRGNAVQPIVADADDVNFIRATRWFFVADSTGSAIKTKSGGQNRPPLSIDSQSAERPDLRLERTAAAAAFRGVGVFEREAAFFEAFVEIDRRAVEIQGALLVDYHAHAVAIVFRVDLFVVLLVEAQAVLEAAAAAAGHADAQHCRAVPSSGLQ